MQLRVFKIPLEDSGEGQAEMNRFLSGVRVLEIEQHFVQNEKGAYWSFCVRYLQGSAVSSGASASVKGKTDYKELLSAEEFAVFSKLRMCRKTIAANDAVPAYAVFTDEELAGMARLPELVPCKLISVKGIGDKKIEKYGKPLLELFASMNASDETGRQVDRENS